MASQPKDDAQVTELSEVPRVAYERIARSLALHVVAGPDAGKLFTIDSLGDGRVLIGQSPACAVRVADPTVSRRHAALELVGGALRISDLGSTNGTWVNGLRIFDVVVTGGETVQLGNTLLNLEPRSGAKEPATDQNHFGTFVGASDEIRCLYPAMARIAAASIPVVIEGETGTGKEVLAESLHDLGPRAAAPFVVFDCTTIAPNLMEAALFGHEKGAFTGALAATEGLFEQADGGTLFIDEIGDLDVALQAKLLRAIEKSEVRRIGGKSWLRVDVRIIAATRRDLDREVQSGRFRDDLFFRLAIARIELPPLRRRRKDIALLATHFWKELGGAPAALTGDLLKRLEDYDWPGNVRELRNAITQKIILGELAKPRSPVNPSRDDAAVRPTDLIGAILDENLPFPIARDKALDLFEERYVARVLERYGGNVTHAAHASGIGRRYFQTIRSRRKS